MVSSMLETVIDQTLHAAIIGGIGVVVFLFSLWRLMQRFPSASRACGRWLDRQLQRSEQELY